MNCMQSSMASDLQVSLGTEMTEGWDLPVEEAFNGGDLFFFLLITTRRNPLTSLQLRTLTSLAAVASVFFGSLKPQLVVHPGFLPYDPLTEDCLPQVTGLVFALHRFVSVADISKKSESRLWEQSRGEGRSMLK